MEPEDFDDDDEADDADFNCGLTMMDDESEMCSTMAGTEYCDYWECPLSRRSPTVPKARA